MSRFDAGSRLTVKPAANVYSSLAVIGALALLAALAYTVIQMKSLVWT